jgi:hypothetical protein
MLDFNISTKEVYEAVCDKLLASPELVGKLAKSRPISNSKGALDRRNSIVPMSKIMDQTAGRPTPLLGVRSGNMTKAGFHSFDVFIFIRCYNSLDKTYVEINEVMSLVASLLDKQNLTMESAVLADMTLEQIGDEEYDEGYKLNYREGLFKLTIT